MCEAEPTCFKLLTYFQKLAVTSAIVYNLDKLIFFFFARVVYFEPGIVQNLKQVAMIKCELISGHFKNYCFEFSMGSARPYCPHLGPIAPTGPCYTTK